MTKYMKMIATGAALMFAGGLVIDLNLEFDQTAWTSVLAGVFVTGIGGVLEVIERIKAK